MMSASLALALAVGAVAAAPDHLAIGITVVPERGVLAADARLTLPPVSAGEEVRFVLSREFRVDAVEADGAVAAIEPTDRPWGGLQLIRITYAEARDRPEIRLRYAGRPSPGGELPINMITPALTELSLDGGWVPIRQGLDGRFTVDARIAGLPDGAALIGQGTQSRTGGIATLVRAYPDIDFAFVAAAGLQRVAESGFELHARDPDSAQARLYRTQGAAALRFLEGWFGAIPNGPVRVALVSRARGSGYARAGYMVVTEGRTLEPVGGAKFIAHEFAHAWFANANAATEHRWLDESIAEYVSLRFVAATLGDAALETLLAPKREPARRAGPILGGARGDGELYAKGPLLLFELEERIGRPAMDRLIARVAAERIGTTPAYLAALGDVAGAENARWFEARLRA